MTDLQQRLLDASLPHIVFDGWTLGVLEQGAASVGLTAFDVKRAFPEGVSEAVSAFAARADAAMLETLQRDYDMPAMKIRERIATAVMVRLRAQTAHREAVRRALAFYMMPWNMSAGTQTLYRTVDTIWRAAGDTSTDYNFYTKRLMLAKVYTATVRVWLDDTSDTLAETEAFLRRRIENVMQIEKLKAKAREQMGTARDWLRKYT